MTGNKDKAVVVLQERDRRVLEALDTLRVIDREQARVLGPFGSVTRANTRLLKLTTTGLLSRLTVGTRHGGHKHLYARTRQGAAAVRHTYRVPPWNAHSPIVAGQPLLEHQLRLNELYLVLRSASTGVHLDQWSTFLVAPAPEVPSLIPDAYVELSRGLERHALFVEIDLATEPLRTWIRKTDRYVALARSGAFHRIFGHTQFRVAVVVPTLGRLHSLRRIIATRTSKLFWLTTFDALHPTAIWSESWWRPTGESPVFII